MPYSLIADALNHLGWRHAEDRQLVTDHTVRRTTRETIGVLENLVIGPRRRSERHELTTIAAELARDSLSDPAQTP